MKRLLPSLAAALALTLAAASPAAAEFGFQSLDATFTNEDGSPAMGAGSHPYAFTTEMTINTRVDPVLGVVPEGGGIRTLEVDLPPGFAVNPSATPRCSSEDFLEFNKDTGSDCPDNTAVGFLGVRKAGDLIASDFAAVYNLLPPPGVAAKLGFHALGVTVTLDGGVREGGDRNAFAALMNVSQAEPFGGSELTIWGNPASPAHDAQRGNCAVFAGSCPAGTSPRAFVTMPTSCSGPISTSFKADSWEDPGTYVQEASTSHDNSVPPNPLGVSGCEKLGFGPTISAQATSRNAASPTGLDFSLEVKDEGLLNPTGTARSAIKKVVATLPEGVTVNPSAAEGLGVCSLAQYEAERLDAAPGEGCPETSKIGTVAVRTPLLEGEVLEGALYQAQQDDPAAPGKENPFDTLLALYVVIDSPQRGVFIKQAGKVEPDPNSGQLISTFDDIPQLPFESFRLHFREGDRAPLITPPACGTYTTTAQLTPWSDPAKAVSATSTFEVTAGPGGSACPPPGAPPFAPGFAAGSINNDAGAFSPFYMRLTRQDGEQDMTRFDSILPPGVTGSIRGIAKCPDAALAAAKAKSGREELAAPSCPEASRIGHVLAGAGAGPALTFVEGQIYLAGPFGGDPLSIAVITPAVAGPFDAGTVVTRVALTLNPVTAEVEVDGAASDPIPHLLKGIPLKLRDLRVFVDRPNLTLNPTNCDPSQVRATLFGSALDLFSAADDVPVALGARYQAANCASLRFKPKLTLRLKGRTKRSANTALRAVYTPRAGDANLKGAVISLPPSQFIDNAHINNPCTRAQFAAEACPPGSVLGTARAFTPLLDEPLEGKVYFRANGGERDLPDVVAALKGQFDVNLVIAILTSKNGRVRSKVLNAPDAPVSKVVLSMAGGKKGLFENSENLCRKKQRAALNLLGQNGKRYRSRPIVKVACKAKRKGAGRHLRG